MKIFYDDNLEIIDEGETLKSFLEKEGELPVRVTVNGKALPGSTVLQEFNVIEIDDEVGELITESSKDDTVNINIIDFNNRCETIEVSTDPNDLRTFYQVPVTLTVVRQGSVVRTNFLQDGDQVTAMPKSGTKGGC